jgi:microcystin degradation protein MlrC
MRIVTGGISHESSSFAPTPTRRLDFETGFGLYRAEEIIDRFRGSNSCTGGFIAGAEKHGFELLPLLWTFAYPGGLVIRSDYEALKEEFLDRLAQVQLRGAVDGVLLDLHGSMVVEEIDDGDGDFIESERSWDIRKGRLGPGWRLHRIGAACGWPELSHHRHVRPARQPHAPPTGCGHCRHRLRHLSAR